MFTLYRKLSKDRLLELIIIYLLILISLVGSIWLPYYFAQLALQGQGMITP